MFNASLVEAFPFADRVGWLGAWLHRAMTAARHTPGSHPPTYVAHFVSADVRGLQRTLALHGARQVGPSRRVADVAGVRAYELTLISNYAVLELLVDRFGAWPLYYVGAAGEPRVWFPAMRPQHLNGYQLDLLARSWGS